MLMIVEIWLTVAAWRAGWKAWALLPIACSAGFGFLLGAGGVELNTIMKVGVMGDIAACIALGVLCAVKPSGTGVQEPECEDATVQQVSLAE